MMTLFTEAMFYLPCSSLPFPWQRSAALRVARADARRRAHAACDGQPKAGQRRTGRKHAVSAEVLRDPAAGKSAEEYTQGLRGGVKADRPAAPMLRREPRNERRQQRFENVESDKKRKHCGRGPRESH